MVSFIDFLFGGLATYLGGIEITVIVLTVLLAIYLFVNKATLPTMFFVVFLLMGSAYGEFGGVFRLLFGLVTVAGAIIMGIAIKQQFSNV